MRVSKCKSRQMEGNESWAMRRLVNYTPVLFSLPEHTRWLPFPGRLEFKLGPKSQRPLPSLTLELSHKISGSLFLTSLLWCRCKLGSEMAELRGQRAWSPGLLLGKELPPDTSALPQTFHEEELYSFTVNNWQSARYLSQQCSLPALPNPDVVSWNSTTAWHWLSRQEVERDREASEAAAMPLHILQWEPLVALSSAATGI